MLSPGSRINEPEVNPRLVDMPSLVIEIAVTIPPLTTMRTLTPNALVHVKGLAPAAIENGGILHRILLHNYNRSRAPETLGDSLIFSAWHTLVIQPSIGCQIPSPFSRHHCYGLWLRTATSSLHNKRIEEYHCRNAKGLPFLISAYIF